MKKLKYNKNFFKTLKKSLFENFRIKIVCVILSIIAYFFIGYIQRTERTYSCKVVITGLNQSMAIANDIPEYIKITVRDKQKILDKITDQDFNVHLNLEGLDPGIDHTLYYQWDVPKPVSSFFSVITLSPEKVTLKTRKIIEKNIEVKPDILMAESSQMNVSNILITPAEVKISGPEKIVQSITHILTEQIDISKESGIFAREVKLIHPNESVHFSPETVMLEMIIEELEQEKIFQSTNYIATNIKANLNPVFEKKPVILKISGKFGNTGLTNEIPLILNCQSFNFPGVQMIKIEPDLPEGFRLISVSPDQIRVNIEYKKDND